MAVLYRLGQNKMKKSSAYGTGLVQEVMTDTVDTDELAEIMQRNCTVKKYAEELENDREDRGGSHHRIVRCGWCHCRRSTA